MNNASKDFNGSVTSLMKGLCTNVNVTIKNVSDLDLCLELVTFKEAEIIDGLELYTVTNSTIVQYPVQWKQFFHPSKLNAYLLGKVIDKISSYSLFLVFGRCLFVNNLGRLREYQFIKLNIKSDKTYQIFFHDPRFFFFSLNPLSLPLINLKINMPDLIPDKTIKASTGFKPIVQQWIYAVKNVKYNREQAPCIEDINYSFTSCIIDHIVKSTNCTVSQLQ